VGIELILVVATMAAVLGVVYLRDRRRLLSARAEKLAPCRELLERPSEEVQRDGFPEFRGFYRGYPVVVRVTTESLAVRKLPSLWLEATVLGDIPYRGTLDYLIRPHNVEFYSPSTWLEHRIRTPKDWPARQATLRTDAPGEAPPLDVVRRHIGLFEDQRTKELVVSPKGVRLVYQADEGVRSHYLLLRQAYFDGGPVDGKLVRILLDAAIAAMEDLQATHEKANPAEEDESAEALVTGEREQYGRVSA
jgi:hypothetical protein